MRARRVTAAVVALLVAATASPASASSDSAVRWTTTSESSECGEPYIGTPVMSRIGILADSERVLGPMGGYFGRSIAAVRSQLVYWTVPMSAGRRVLVHQRALGAFQEVAVNLAAEEAAGRSYDITSAAAFVPRTIGGVRQLSRHGLGSAIDINPAQNPYSSDPDRLITNMPDWFVAAWRAAGFCWGGDWSGSKDPMHFSWMGPSEGLDPMPPIGTQTEYRQAAAYAAPWPLTGQVLLADVGGFGAVDVAAVRDHAAGSVIDVASSRAGFAACSHYRSMSGLVVPADALVSMGDVDGDSRADLVAVAPDGTISVASRRSAYQDVVTSAGPVSGARAVAIADFNSDRVGDLFVVDSSGNLTVVAGPGFTTTIHTAALGAVPDRIAAGDRDGDTQVELFATTDGGVTVLRRSGDSWSAEETEALPGPAAALAVADEDGDGRGDIALLTEDGTLVVAVGNTSTGRAVDAWWNNPLYECPDEPIPFQWSGAFYDDDTSIFESDVEAIAAVGVTKGCNPPYNDAFCPAETVTRGQMAAFLVRALGLGPADGDVFTDDDGSVFEDDINRLAGVEITRGCGPGLFCPEDEVTREQMAAFLVRAFLLAAAPDGDPFTDDDGSVFEAEIEALAAVGVTRGCSSAGDRFCPRDLVTRGQMAAFLIRARSLQ